MGTRLNNCTNCQRTTYNKKQICSDCQREAKSPPKKAIHTGCMECVNTFEFKKMIDNYLCPKCLKLAKEIFKSWYLFFFTAQIKLKLTSMPKECMKCKGFPQYLKTLAEEICKKCQQFFLEKLAPKW